ncbi:MAG: hypothetical protein IJH68_13135 [Thermoguttaceae bacterium]|nr:hypothetical protein [Thermoguttaceae bacterium]
MLNRILQNWLASQVTPELRRRVGEAAKSSIREAVCGAMDAAQEEDAERARSEVWCGLVFGDRSEYGCLTDLMNRVHRTRADGRLYLDGFLNTKRIVLVDAGPGSAAGAAAAEALIQAFSPKRVIAAGFAGALVKNMRRGRVILPKILTDEESGQTIDLWQPLLEGSAEAGKADANGTDANSADANDPDDADVLTLLSTTSVAKSPDEKRRRAEKYGASLCDTASFAVAAVCRRLGVPFLCVRVILDELDEVVPSDLKDLESAVPFKENPARFLGTLFGTVKRRPSSLLDMYKVKENALISADTLANRIARILTRS